MCGDPTRRLVAAGDKARVEERGVGDEDDAAEGSLRVPLAGVDGSDEGVEIPGHRWGMDTAGVAFVMSEPHSELSSHSAVFDLLVQVDASLLLLSFQNFFQTIADAAWKAGEKVPRLH